MDRWSRERHREGVVCQNPSTDTKRLRARCRGRVNGCRHEHDPFESTEKRQAAAQRRQVASKCRAEATVDLVRGVRSDDVIRRSDGRYDVLTTCLHAQRQIEAVPRRLGRRVDLGVGWWAGGLRNGAAWVVGAPDHKPRVRYNAAVTAMLTICRDQLVALCQKYHVRRLDVFGSAARDDFDEQSSDIDFSSSSTTCHSLIGAMPIWASSPSPKRCWGVASISSKSAVFATPIFAKGSSRRGNCCMPRDPRAWLLDILAACDLLADFTGGKSFEDYAADALLRSAVERQLEIIGEALRVAVKHQPVLRRRLASGIDVAAAGTYGQVDGVNWLHFPAFDAPDTNHGIADGLDGERVDQF